MSIVHVYSSVNYNWSSRYNFKTLAILGAANQYTMESRHGLERVSEFSLEDILKACMIHEMFLFYLNIMVNLSCNLQLFLE